MRHYEVVLLVHPDQSDQLSDMLKRYQDLVTKNGGEIHRVEDIGRLQLAYTINDMHKAHYVLMNLECDSQTLSEIKSSFEFNDSIMRHLVVRMTKAETTPSKLFILHNKDTERKNNKSEERKKIDSEIGDKGKSVDQQDNIKLTEASSDLETNKDLDVKSEIDLNKSNNQVSAKKEEAITEDFTAPDSDSFDLPF